MGFNLRRFFFVRLFFGLIIVCALNGCAHNSVISLDTSHVTARSAIIFVPGYYGSALVDNRNRRIFLTAGGVLFGTKSIALHADELGIANAADLHVEGVLGAIPVVPLYSIDVYRGFLDHLNEVARKQDAQVFAFAYDWREELSVAAAQLDRLVDELRSKGVSQVTLVAHSMGCLVAAYELGYGNQPLKSAHLDWRGSKKIQRVVFMAGPFDGVFSVFRNMQRGSALGRKSLLSAETIASLPSSYELLPFRDAHILSAQGDSSPLPIGDFEYWRKHQLSLLGVAKLTPKFRQARETFTQKQLAQAKHFSDLIHFDGAQAPDGLKVLAIRGNGRPTTLTAYHVDATNEYFFDGDNLRAHHLTEKNLMTDGDSTVTVNAALLPAAFASHSQQMTTSEIHSGVFRDERFMKALDTFLQ